MKGFLAVCFLGCIAWIFSACGNKAAKNEFTYTKEAPVILFDAVVDETNNSSAPQLNWDVGEELTKAVRVSLEKEGSLFLLPISQADMIEENEEQGRAYSASAYDYRVQLALLEREQVPYKSGMLPPSKVRGQRVKHLIKMRYRLRVEENKQEESRVVLQEQRTLLFPIFANQEEPNYGTVSWGTGAYKDSPVGISHKQFANELAQRLLDYIPKG